MTPMRSGVNKPDDPLLNIPTLIEKKPLAENVGREKPINKYLGEECTVFEILFRDKYFSIAAKPSTTREKPFERSENANTGIL